MPTPTATTSPDQSAAGQAGQSLNDLQNSLQGTDVPVPAPEPADTLDQDLNGLLQALQAQPAP